MFARRGIKAMGNNNPYAPPKAAIGDLPGGTSSSFITLYWSGRGKLWKIYWVSVWRCAFNAESRAWGYAARFLVVIGFISTMYFIVTGHFPYRTLFGR
jgi:hypothetical protein